MDEPGGGDRAVSLVENEQVKLTATYLNGLAITVFAVGAFAPTIAILSGTVSGQPLPATMLALICIAASASLHVIARRSLRKLKP